MLRILRCTVRTVLYSVVFVQESYALQYSSYVLQRTLLRSLRLLRIVHYTIVLYYGSYATFVSYSMYTVLRTTVATLPPYYVQLLPCSTAYYRTTIATQSTYCTYTVLYTQYYYDNYVVYVVLRTIYSVLLRNTTLYSTATTLYTAYISQYVCYSVLFTQYFVPLVLL